jgi:amidase/aspartyl-tRNA(Asn)/glutamyl-tRNA(Gln) amidotransferase subunit A
VKESEFSTLSAFDSARMVAAKQVSPVELVRAAIERIDATHAALNAVVFKDFDGAIERAGALEARIMRGEPIGPMAGVPTLIKDLYDFRPGWPSTLGGIPALRNFIPSFWSTYPQRMEQADAILLGKTNSPVMGARAISDNPMFGATCNPFDLSRNSGGSSGGSAAAVAARVVPVAGGSDGGGSIRIPAAWCGAYGFQPSFGRVPMVSRPNGFGLAAPFIYEGPITRDVRDAALAMTVLSGFDTRDPYSIDGTVDYLGALARPIAGLRIGFTPDFGVFPVDAGVAAVVANAVSAFSQAGAHVERLEFKLPYSQQELCALWWRMISQSAYAVLNDLQAKGIDLLIEHRHEIPPAVLEWADVAARMSLAEMQRDQLMRTTVYDAFCSLFDGYDLIVSPTTAVTAVLNQAGGNTLGPSMVNGEAVDPHVGWCLTYLTNLTGHPSASVPAGLVYGLPVGLQIIGRRLADADVIAASAAFERERNWSTLYDLTALKHTAP